MKKANLHVDAIDGGTLLQCKSDTALTAAAASSKVVGSSSTSSSDSNGRRRPMEIDEAAAANEAAAVRGFERLAAASVSMRFGIGCDIMSWQDRQQPPTLPQAVCKIATLRARQGLQAGATVDA